MGLRLTKGKRLKHLKEKPLHKTQYDYLDFLWKKNSAEDAKGETET
jgi:hypothetical protein